MYIWHNVNEGTPWNSEITIFLQIKLTNYEKTYLIPYVKHGAILQNLWHSYLPVKLKRFGHHHDRIYRYSGLCCKRRKTVHLLMPHTGQISIYRNCNLIHDTSLGIFFFNFGKYIWWSNLTCDNQWRPKQSCFPTKLRRILVLVFVGLIQNHPVSLEGRKIDFIWT